MSTHKKIRFICSFAVLITSTIEINLLAQPPDPDSIISSEIIKVENITKDYKNGVTFTWAYTPGEIPIAKIIPAALIDIPFDEWDDEMNQELPPGTTTWTFRVDEGTHTLFLIALVGGYKWFSNTIEKKFYSPVSSLVESSSQSLNKVTADLSEIDCDPDAILQRFIWDDKGFKNGEINDPVLRELRDCDNEKSIENLFKIANEGIYHVSVYEKLHSIYIKKPDIILAHRDNMINLSLKLLKCHRHDVEDVAIFLAQLKAKEAVPVMLSMIQSVEKGGCDWEHNVEGVVKALVMLGDKKGLKAVKDFVSNIDKDSRWPGKERKKEAKKHFLQILKNKK